MYRVRLSQAILARVEAEHMKLVGAIATHYHFDHTGGVPPPPFDSLGIRLAGVKEVAEQAKVPVSDGPPKRQRHDSKLAKHGKLKCEVR